MASDTLAILKCHLRAMKCHLTTMKCHFTAKKWLFGKPKVAIASQTAAPD